MNLRDNFLDALAGKDVEATPVACVTQSGVVEAMDKLGFYWPEAHKDPEMIVKLGASLYEYAGVECIRIPFCLTVEAEALGADVNLGNKERTPEVEGSPFNSADEIDIPDDFLEQGRIPTVIKAIELAKEKYGGEVPIIVGVCGPFTLTGQLLGVENLVRMLMNETEQVEEGLETSLDACMDYADLIVEAEPDAICMPEPTASPELLNPMQFGTLVKGALQDYAEVIDIPKILHICGTTQPIVKDMASIGWDGISVEEKLPFDVATKELATVNDPSRLVGNVSTSQTIFRGTPEEVKAESKSALEKGADILAPSCGVSPLSPLANLKAMVEARNEYCNL